MSNRCLCMNKDGRQCSRNAQDKGLDTRFCWQHQKSHHETNIIVEREKITPIVKQKVIQYQKKNQRYAEQLTDFYNHLNDDFDSQLKSEIKYIMHNLHGYYVSDGELNEKIKMLRQLISTGKKTHTNLRIKTVSQAYNMIANRILKYIPPRKDHDGVKYCTYFMTLKINGLIVAQTFLIDGHSWNNNKVGHPGDNNKVGHPGDNVLAIESMSYTVPFILCLLLFQRYQFPSTNQYFIPEIIEYAKDLNAQLIVANLLKRQGKMLKKYGFVDVVPPHHLTNCNNLKIETKMQLKL